MNSFTPIGLLEIIKRWKMKQHRKKNAVMYEVDGKVYNKKEWEKKENEPTRD